MLKEHFFSSSVQPPKHLSLIYLMAPAVLAQATDHVTTLVHVMHNTGYVLCILTVHHRVSLPHL